MERDAKYWIERLHLKPLSQEGGYYNETYTSDHIFKKRYNQEDSQINRPLSTCIYYLLTSADVSRLHKLKSDEIWCFHQGSTLLLHCFGQSSNYQKIRLGIDEDSKPQFIVHAGTIFGGKVEEPGEYTLVSCIVSPGFSFEDFELVSPETLLKTHPGKENIIELLT